MIHVMDFDSMSQAHMTRRENKSSTLTLDGYILTSICRANATFLQRCGVPQYRGTALKLDEVLYTECCQEAINRDIPMDGKYSISPYMSVAVALAGNAFSHLPDRATWRWICLLLSIAIGIDDNLGGALDMTHVYHFNEQFVHCQPQGNPALKAFDTFLREAPRYFSPLVSNLITTSMLDYMSSLLLDHETKDMQPSTHAPTYPEYGRLLSGFAAAAVLFIFPSTIPVQEYIQSMPDLIIVMNYTNDILSFYKEESQGETTTYVSRLAASRAITKLDVLHETIDKTVQAHHNILRSFKAHADAYDAYDRFFHGYIEYYASPRYKLQELMSKASKEGHVYKYKL